MKTQQSQPSLAEQTYLRLHQDILTCVLTPGQVISERELSRRYAVSKTPIREALAQTCYDGLVQRLPGRGYMVSPITIKDIRDLFDLRLILELAAVERAVLNPSPTLIAGLKKMANVRYELNDPDSHVTFLKTNREFHLALAEAASNLRLMDQLQDLFNEMDRLFHLGLRLRDSSEEMVREHCDVVKALEDGDVMRVKEVVTQQIITSRDRILEAIIHGKLAVIQV